MAKFRGPVLFAETKETTPGVWAEKITQRYYTGDITKIAKRVVSGDSVNDNVVIMNVISIVADTYANQNFAAIKAIKWMGVRWKVTHVGVDHPRLILSLGGVDNGDQISPT